MDSHKLATDLLHAVLSWRGPGGEVSPEDMLDFFDSKIKEAQVEAQQDGVVRVADPKAMPQLPHRLRFQLLEESAEDWHFTEEEVESSLGEDRSVILDGEILLDE